MSLLARLSPSDLIVPTCFVGIALLLRPCRPGLSFWRRLAPLGAISYGIYAIAYPVQVFVRHAWPAFSGGVLTWTTRATLVVVLAFAAASWLELRLQPWINARLSIRASTPS